MTCICQRQIVSSSGVRAFSTSARRTVTIHHKSNLLDDVADIVPAYPFPSNLYRQGQKGLYGGSRIQFGNCTGEENMPRARRTWSLNVKRKRLYSEALDQNVQLQVTTRVLRTIRKYGGLDEYLLGEKPARIKALGEAGWWLRWAIMQTDTVKARFNQEQQKLMSQLAADQEAQTKQSRLLDSDKKQSKLPEPANKPRDDHMVVTSTIASPPETEATSQDTAESSRRRFKRITFRVDRGKHVVFNGKTWTPDRAREAASKRDVLRIARLQQLRKPSERDLPTETLAARYMEASLTNKKLQRNMPPRMVLHRRWLLRHGQTLRSRLTKKLGDPGLEKLIERSLHEQDFIAKFIKRRIKATTYQR